MILLFLLVACAHVPAWERAALMDPCMRDPLDPASAAFDAHVDGIREGMVEAGSGGGAACGCN
jgi:hypothetical protein